MPVYNKLIRDRIPDIIENDGKAYRTRILKDDEYHTELIRKLSEEFKELKDAEDEKAAQEELADILEIIYSLAEVNGTNFSEIEKIRFNKKEKRGGFEKKIYLIDVED